MSTLKQARKDYFSSWQEDFDSIEKKADELLSRCKDRDFKEIIKSVSQDIKHCRKLIEMGMAFAAAQNALSIGYRWAAIQARIELPDSPGRPNDPDSLASFIKGIQNWKKASVIKLVQTAQQKFPKRDAENIKSEIRRLRRSFQT